MNSLQRYDDIPAPLKWFIVTIKEVGFPIAVCIYLTWFNTVELQKHTEAVTQLTFALEKNTQVLKLMAHKLRVDGD